MPRRRSVPPLAVPVHVVACVCVAPGTVTAPGIETPQGQTRRLASGEYTPSVMHATVCCKDTVRVGGSTARAMGKHANAPMHAWQEMYTHVEPEHGARSQHDRHRPNTHPPNHAPHPHTHQPCLGVPTTTAGRGVDITAVLHLIFSGPWDTAPDIPLAVLQQCAPPPWTSSPARCPPTPGVGHGALTPLLVRARHDGRYECAPFVDREAASSGGTWHACARHMLLRPPCPPLWPQQGVTVTARPCVCRPSGDAPRGRAARPATLPAPLHHAPLRARRRRRRGSLQADSRHAGRA